MFSRASIVVLAVLALISTKALADDDFEWIVLPNSETSSDRGIGGGVLGLFHWYEKGVEPYRDRIEAAAVITTKLFQNHYIIWERLGLRRGALRLRFKVGFIATLNHNFCGIGNKVTCDEGAAIASTMADGFDPSDPEFGERVDRYYLFPAKRPYARAGVRWRALKDRPSLELAASWSGTLEVAGTFSKAGPYAGSLFEAAHPDGEEEFLQVAEVGVLRDRRDNEIHPTDGDIIGIYARTGLGLSASPRLFAGTTVSVGRYDSVWGGDLVLANRAVFDLLGGRVPVRELGEVGGLWQTSAFGGGFGRGVRANRFIGKVKLTAQNELRWRSQPIIRRARFLANAFVDTGWVAASVQEMKGDRLRLLASVGVGPGISWGRSFVARLDVGVSSYESWGPFLYLRVGHPF